ncbi:hypothetical protein P7K49_002373, partial [Saguinus oedipus]
MKGNERLGVTMRGKRGRLRSGEGRPAEKPQQLAHCHGDQAATSLAPLRLVSVERSLLTHPGQGSDAIKR